MLYRAKTDKDLGVKACKIIGDTIPLGYALTETFFVDNSGFGGEGIALNFPTKLTKIQMIHKVSKSLSFEFFSTNMCIKIKNKDKTDKGLRYWTILSLIF